MNTGYGLRVTGYGLRLITGGAQLATVLLLLAFCSLTFGPIPAYSGEISPLEVKLTRFVKQIYEEERDIRVKFNNIPDNLRDNAKVKNISFAKVPDSSGDGICLVEIEEKNQREKSVYISFKVFIKKKLFILRHNGKSGDRIRPEDILVKEAHLSEKSKDYPSRIEEVLGKVLKKDASSGTIVTYSIVDDPVLVQRGATVTIQGENKKLFVQTKGKALEKGRMGDTIKVKNISSDREIFGKITGSNVVAVEF